MNRYPEPELTFLLLVPVLTLLAGLAFNINTIIAIGIVGFVAAGSFRI